jgi:hypothetical protein
MHISTFKLPAYELKTDLHKIIPEKHVLKKIKNIQ